MASLNGEVGMELSMNGNGTNALDATTSISGYCHTAFSSVADAFARNFADGHEIGASVSVMLRGKTVVDLWGG